MKSLKSFEINGLYGTKDIKLEFHDNRLILVGENGSGKTTILRIFYCFISQMWTMLVTGFDFKSLIINTENENIKVTRNEIEQFINILANEERYLPESRNREIRRLIERGFDEAEACQIVDKRNIERLIFNLSKSNDFKKIEQRRKEIKDKIEKIFEKTKVFYLPTYRRIEQELQKLFTDIDDDYFIRRMKYAKSHKSNTFTEEIIEFGMKDVQNNIYEVLQILQKDTLDQFNNLAIEYLRDIVEGKIKNVDENILEKIKLNINDIFSRFDDKILSSQAKNNIIQKITQFSANIDKNKGADKYDLVLCHYVIKLYNLYNELVKKEKRIRDFFNICNEYLVDKEFVYDSTQHNYSLKSKNQKDLTIELSQLSSGEKQVVSLFSYLFLSSDNNYFIIIDEPELSLSVEWQNKYLIDISKGNACAGFLAVTHSPFIFDNELEKYAFGISQFKTEKYSKK